MRQSGKTFLILNVVCLAILAVMAVLAETVPAGLDLASLEDRVVENLTAALFGISSLGFLVFAIRSRYLKQRGGLAYSMTIAWVLLMFVFMGEEISWGQRIFDITTPDALAAINKQQETNIHNIELVDSLLGGKYRYLSVMMLTVGLLLPAAALTRIGRRWLQRIAFPVAPIGYWALFVGAYWYGKYYWGVEPTFPTEVREFLMAIGMAAFAWHGALRPALLFRLERDDVGGAVEIRDAASGPAPGARGESGMGLARGSSG